MTSVYRYYDASGKLLYVGTADQWERRACDHSKSKPWFGDVRRVELHFFATRKEALEAERMAIVAEHPEQNTVHNRRVNELESLNVRIGSEMRSALKMEAAASGVTVQELITSILADFFKSWSSEERGKFYRSTGQKPYGRQS